MTDIADMTPEQKAEVLDALQAEARARTDAAAAAARAAKLAALNPLASMTTRWASDVTALQAMRPTVSDPDLLVRVDRLIQILGFDGAAIAQEIASLSPPVVPSPA